ncbi:MAG: radical SAM protein [Gemmataceae bacterium]
MPLTQPITVGLVQINNSFSGQNYLPYSVGLLQASVQRHAAEPGRYRFLLPLYKRLPVARAVAQLLEADVVAFSAYVWNVRLSLAIARELKRLKPHILIVFGGPQVPDRGENFVRQHPFVDLAVHGEGESAFRLLLEEYPRGRWEEVPSLSFLRGDQYVATPRAPRMGQLATLPSPYLEGIFAPLLAAHPDEQWLALWETNRGCPFSCTFCDWGSATAAKVYQFDIERLYEEIDWFARQRIEFIFCCDANFGMLPRDLELARRVVEVRGRTGYPQALSVQNTKNATERAYQVQKTLADAGLNKGVTLSLQTVDERSLQAIKRQNISSSFYEELQRRFSADGIETYTDMILGLPEETYDSFVDGMAHIVASGQHNRIQFNNLSILPNAEMGDPAYQERHGLQLVSTRIINIHGTLAGNDSDDVQEYQELVIGTRTLPAADWCRTRALCWMASFLYFDKVLQIPLLLLHKVAGQSFRTLIELFTAGDLAPYPTLAAARQFFLDKARDIQQGGEEYCRSERWLNIYWPADELLLIELCTEARLWDFYDEAQELLTDFLTQHGLLQWQDVLNDAVALNRGLLKLPFHDSDLELELGHNIWSMYRAARRGGSVPVERGHFVHRIERTSQRYESWADWCQRVVWYGNKKGAYLYASTVAEPQLEGHY